MRSSLFFLAVFTSVVFLSGCSTGADKKYLWLENIESEKALKWVKEESDFSKNILSKEDGFEKRQDRILKRLESKDKIIYVRQRGKFVYNFWKDKKNQRGLWRRAPYKAFIRGWRLKWEELLDVDALSVKENKKWVFKGVLFSRKNTDRVILKLSDGGGDAVSLREYSLKSKKFLNKGMDFKAARYGAVLLDDKAMLLASDSDKEKLTKAKYPREVKLYKRGRKFEEAKTLLTIPEEHTGVWLYTLESSKGKRFDVVEDAIDFYSSNKYIYSKEKLFKIPAPVESAIEGVFKNKIIFTLRKDLVLKGENVKKGSLVYLSVDSKDKFSDLKHLYSPKKGEAVKNLGASKKAIVLVVQENVSKKGYLLSFSSKGIQKKKINVKGEFSLLSSNPDDEKLIVQTSSFIEPQTIIAFDLKKNNFKVLQKGKAYFPSKDYTFKQDWAVSDDGTKIPFYLVHKKSLKLNGANPTIMYGYGGFEISLNPFYLKTRVPEWVSKGGVFVLANIRGGGEFGPEWHQAAQKFNKRKSYEDFAAIAKKLSALKVTSSDHLGIVGGSNGGLLVGASAVLYPELYKAVFCVVPLLDMLRYDQLLVGGSWISEYGDPKIKKEREYIKTYSPFQNVKKGVTYPEIFFYTSTHDDRVHPGHARKMYKKMKDFGQKVYYYENSEGGHAGSSSLKQKALSKAMKYSFFWKVLK